MDKNRLNKICGQGAQTALRIKREKSMIRVHYNGNIILVVENREDLVAFVTDLVKTVPRPLKNWLPHYTLEQNCKYSACRILYEYGCDVVRTS